MKSLFSLLLSATLLLTLAGCQQDAPTPDGIPYYYCVAQPDYTKGSTVLAPEYRIKVQDASLAEALQQYLEGPITPELKSPIPQGVKLVKAIQEGDTVYLTLSWELATLTDLDLTLACGCLTLTALAMTDARQVEIRAEGSLLDGQRAIVMDKNTLLLLDNAMEGE